MPAFALVGTHNSMVGGIHCRLYSDFTIWEGTKLGLAEAQGCVHALFLFSFLHLIDTARPGQRVREAQISGQDQCGVERLCCEQRKRRRVALHTAITTSKGPGGTTPITAFVGLRS